MSTGWNWIALNRSLTLIINLLGNEYWLERVSKATQQKADYKPTGK